MGLDGIGSGLDDPGACRVLCFKEPGEPFLAGFVAGHCRQLRPTAVGVLELKEAACDGCLFFGGCVAPGKSEELEDDFLVGRMVHVADEL